MTTPAPNVFSRPAVEAVSAEFVGVQLGDARRNARLQKVARSMAQSPDHSFPQALATESELLGHYRLMSNPAVAPQEIARPHFEASFERTRGRPYALCVHDTSGIEVSHECAGIGPLPGNKRGYLLHASLLLSDEQSRLPLGTGSLMTWTRDEISKCRDSNGQKLSGRQLAKRADRESNRWLACVERAEERRSELDGAPLIHVADQEADSFELLSEMEKRERQFVFRIGRDRELSEGSDEDSLVAAMARAPIKDRVEVKLSRRVAKKAPKSAKRHPSRRGRKAQLAISAVSVELRRPKSRPDLPESVRLNVVQVKEINPPAGEPPVEWWLATTEPVATPSQIARVIDAYRARWGIEEYFKALKTGCRLQQRLLESYDRLLRALALFLPIAWQMLLLRQLPRENPSLDASLILTPTQLAVLKADPKLRLPPRPTLEQAALAIARLGGHLKRNGPPGWITLARGMESLTERVTGWNACKAAMGEDLEM